MIKNRTKILATIGPSCDRIEMLRTMVKRGVNGFRINLSYGNNDEKRSLFKRIRQVSILSGGSPCILADLAGPKIRVSAVIPGLELEEGQLIRISNEQPADPGTIAVSDGFSFGRVNSGAQILINDGRVRLEVMGQDSPGTLKCRTLIGGPISERKGVNFPNIELEVPPLTPQDKDDLKMALEEGADWVALSFVRSADDRQAVDQIMEAVGRRVPVMAKIEKWEALEDLDRIIKTFDGVMVARGDLGVETPQEQVPLAQKRIIRKANQAGKPVVIATQMLESMIDSPVPTRAEVSDIANAIFDGSDALLVTGETAIGQYPENVVKVLMQVIQETEKNVDYNVVHPSTGRQLGTAEAISHATCEVARDLNIPYIVSMTQSGSTARMIARFRPDARILALTPFEEICRQLAIVWGVSPFIVGPYTQSDEIPERARELLISQKLLKSGDRYVVTGGVPVGVPGTTNYLSVQNI